jgi:hypothetical protein
MTQRVDTSLVGHVAADLMDVVAEQFGEEASVETVAIVIDEAHNVCPAETADPDHRSGHRGRDSNRG